MRADTLIKPPRLKKGDNIRIVAPASSMADLNGSAVETGVRHLERLGLKVEISPHARRKLGHTSGAPRDRARDLMDAFIDPAVDCVMAVWGGYNSNDILEHLDFRVFRDNPKVFIGYSDITVLTTVITDKAGLVTFQGPSFVTWTHSFLMDWEVKAFRSATMTGKPYTVRASPAYIDDPDYYMHPETPPTPYENPGWSVLQSGVAEGRLIGGHLGTFLLLAGTPYWPDLTDTVLFVELSEGDGPTGNVARSFRQLRHMGAFNKIKGLAVGRVPLSVGFKVGDNLERILQDCLEGYKFPVLTGIDFGHTNPIATLPVGVKARLDAGRRELKVLEVGTL